MVKRFDKVGSALLFVIIGNQDEEGLDIQ